MDSLTDFNLFYDFFRIWGFGFVKFILRFFCVVDILNAKAQRFLINEIFLGSQRRFVQRFLLLEDFGDFADFSVARLFEEKILNR